MFNREQPRRNRQGLPEPGGAMEEAKGHAGLDKYEVRSWGVCNHTSPWRCWQMRFDCDRATAVK